MLMAAARLDLASVLVYNGSILPGEHNGNPIDITSVFEAVGAAPPAPSTRRSCWPSSATPAPERAHAGGCSRRTR